MTTAAPPRPIERRTVEPVSPPPSPAWLLAAVPVRNVAVRQEHRGGELLLAVPLRRRWWMRRPWSWVWRMRRERAYLLDGLGREVWSACDGRTDVEAITEAFARRHGLRFHEARLCVATFLRSLVERHLVVLVQADEPERSADPGGGEA